MPRRPLPLAAPRPALASIPDKYALEETSPIDCRARLPLCKARCCRAFEVALSPQDVDEGIVRWDEARPYWIARRADLSCFHLEEGACSIYAHRPGVCRRYDCRTDRRIWLDFDARIPAPG